MKRLSFGTRITIWSAIIVACGIVLCGLVSTLYVLRSERKELDGDLRDEARHIIEEWREHGEQRFHWSHNSKEVSEWLSPTSPPRIVQIEDATGHVLFRSKSFKEDFMSGLSPGLHTVPDGKDGWRVLVFQKEGLTLRLAGSMEEVNDLAEQLATTFLITLPIVLIFAVLGARFITRKAIAPIEEITEVAEHITARDLGQRITLHPAQDEIHRLGTVLNATFDRLEKSFLQATRFSADASHELKTPLTILRSSIESMMNSPENSLELQQKLAVLLEETRRLAAITESLLLLSRADAGKLQIDLQRGDLTEIIHLCTEDLAIITEPEEIQMELRLPEAAPAMLDRTRCSQILMNLLDNARKYNRRGGRIRVQVDEDGDLWKVSVANTGPGISPEIAPHLFTRFFRGEHSAETNGQGLGLSLSRELARAHHGDLVLGESGPEWTSFVLSVPKAKPAVEGAFIGSLFAGKITTAGERVPATQ